MGMRVSSSSTLAPNSAHNIPDTSLQGLTHYDLRFLADGLPYELGLTHAPSLGRDFQLLFGLGINTQTLHGHDCITIMNQM